MTIDPGATRYRTESAKRVLDEVRVSVLRGNAGAVATLVASVTGPVDHVSDGERIAAIANGHPLLATITGTGCMSTALTGRFLAARATAPFEGADGPGTFHARLYDALAALEPATLGARAEVEER